MTDLSTLPHRKQYIQLRTCLTPELFHSLHYYLQVPKDDSTHIAEVLSTLDRHFKAQRTRPSGDVSCLAVKMNQVSILMSFFVRIKNLSEAVDICEGGDVSW